MITSNAVKGRKGSIEPPSGKPALQQLHTETPLLEARGITKRFPGVVANDGIDFTLYRGEVHALLGENGAGKTTLMNILYGLYQPDQGQLFIEGKPVRLSSPRQAIDLGIGLVPQHSHLVRRHTVVENLALGLRTTSFFLPARRLGEEIRALADRYGFDVDPEARVELLSAGEKQRVEILKALMRDAKILILDEPTAALTLQETLSLFTAIERMRADGRGVIFITHKLKEVMAIADRVTVLRKGRVVAHVLRQEATAEKLAEWMVGARPIPLKPKVRETPGAFPAGEPPAAEVRPGVPLLEVEDVDVVDDRGRKTLSGLSFTLRRGEILGVAGVAGNGQRELIEVVTGLRRPSRGRIRLGGEAITRRNRSRLFDGAIAHIPEERTRTGVVAGMSVAENLILRAYRRSPFATGPLLNTRAAYRHAEEAIAAYRISAPGPGARVGLLSGGNIQKVILARELSGNPSLIVAAHPTHGLDIAAARLTHELLLEQRAKGAGILLVSEDLDELLELSDRLLVLCAGKITGSLDAREADLPLLGLMMAGGSGT